MHVTHVSKVNLKLFLGRNLFNSLKTVLLYLIDKIIKEYNTANIQSSVLKKLSVKKVFSSIQSYSVVSNFNIKKEPVQN